MAERLGLVVAVSDEATLREAIRNLQDNNLLRLQEIAKLRAQLRTMRARITKLQGIIERHNKERRNA